MSLIHKVIDIKKTVSMDLFTAHILEPLDMMACFEYVHVHVMLICTYQCIHILYVQEILA